MSSSPPSNQAKFLFSKSTFADLDDVTFTFSNGNPLQHHNHNHHHNHHHDHDHRRHHHQDRAAWSDGTNNKGSSAHSPQLGHSKVLNHSPTETSRLTSSRTGSNGKTLTMAATALNSSGGISTVDLLRRQSFLDLTSPQTRQGRYFFQQGLVRSPDYLTDRATPAALALAALAVDSVQMNFSTNRSSGSSEHHERNLQINSLGSMGE